MADFIRAIGVQQLAFMKPIGGDRPYAHLETIKQPTFVRNGDNDIMIATINSYHLAQNIPDAQLILYPDAMPCSYSRNSGTRRDDETRRGFTSGRACGKLPAAGAGESM